MSYEEILEVYAVISINGKGKDRSEKVVATFLSKGNADAEVLFFRKENKKKFPNNRFQVKTLKLCDA